MAKFHENSNIFNIICEEGSQNQIWWRGRIERFSDSAHPSPPHSDMCAKKSPLVSMQGWAEGIFFWYIILAKSSLFYPPAKRVGFCILLRLNKVSSYSYLQDYNWMQCLFSPREIFISQNLILQMHLLKLRLSMYVHSCDMYASLLQVCFKFSSQACFKYDSSMIHVCFKYASSWLQVCYKHTSSMLLICIKYDSRLFLVCFRYLSF